LQLLTKPEFPARRSKSFLIFLPSAVKVNAPAVSSLEHLHIVTANSALCSRIYIQPGNLAWGVFYI